MITYKQGSNPVNQYVSVLTFLYISNIIEKQYADVTQMARVPAFQAGCCGFEFHHPLHMGRYA